MKLYGLRNKAGKGMSIFAENEQRALDIAIDMRHAFKESNLTIPHVKDAPPEYHEGVASRRIPMSNFNIETLQLDPIGDADKMGWYGGGNQQPKVGDPDWDFTQEPINNTPIGNIQIINVDL